MNSASPIPASVATARVVYFNERNEAALRAWIDLVVADSIKSAVSENYVAGVSSAHRNYDVLIVSGNDPRRINRLLRLYRAILTDKVKIAVLAKSTPGERALLLNGGFDDVFDLRTSEVEARVRVLAHIRRSHSRKIAITGQLLHKAGGALDRFFTTRPSPVESRLFKRLIGSAERAVGIAELCETAPGEGNPLNRRSLQVFICRIRKKLIPGLSIEFQGEDGYLLRLSQRGVQLQER